MKKKKKEVEKSLELIRRCNQINEEIKKSYGEYATKRKQREQIVRESSLKAKAKYLKDEDGESSSDGESSRDGVSSRDGESTRDGESSRD